VAADRAIGTATRALVHCGPSVIASKRHHSRRASDHLPTSPSTLGRRTVVYGWKTFGSLVGPEERTMIISLSSTSPSVSGSSFEHGSNSCRPTASVARWSSNRSSLGISRGRTCAPKTPGTSRASNSSLVSPCGTTSTGSPSNAIPSLTSLMQMSSVQSSLGPPASPSFTSLAAGSRAPLASSWTSPRTTPPATRRSGWSSPTVGPKAMLREGLGGGPLLKARKNGRRRIGVAPTPTRSRRLTTWASDRASPTTSSYSSKSGALTTTILSSTSSRTTSSSSACWASLAGPRVGTVMRRRPKISVCRPRTGTASPSRMAAS
jgi:hypothetical protein